jgi:hypothetical protein
VLWVRIYCADIDGLSVYLRTDLVGTIGKLKKGSSGGKQKKRTALNERDARQINVASPLDGIRVRAAQHHLKKN